MPEITLTGANLVAGARRSSSADTFTATNPSTGEDGPTRFHDASQEELAAATTAAAEAFTELRTWSGERIAELLRRIAAEIEGLGEQLIEVCEAETGLGTARLSGERTRTCGQLRAFADQVAGGAHLDAIIDTADPNAQPIPRPDLRRVLIPVGPVAVFGASNFPLAFSVAGGDTASALAAGCPVVVKAHRSHPGTSELVGHAIVAAVTALGAPPGTFSLLHGPGTTIGQALVRSPEIKAVGFTGSTSGGRALFDIAAARPEPIPVYAEMGSLNPVFVTSGALATRAEDIANGFVGSMTLGTGQFCTKPGLLFVPDTDAGEAFVAMLAEKLRAVPSATMLNERIRSTLLDTLEHTAAQAGVETIVRGGGEGPGFRCAPSLLAVEWDVLGQNAALLEEHFGPVALVIRTPEKSMTEAAEQLQGSLTATIHAEEHEITDIAALESVLATKAGRLIWNGYPTGVSVSWAQHHGGPYPATTIPAHTSVGATAIRRFLRPVARQDAPQAALPPALRDDNPLGIMRIVDGRPTRDAI